MKNTHILWVGLLAALALLLTPAAHADQHDEQLAEIRAATDEYQQLETVLADGYAPNFGCVRHAEHGAMGIHHINGDLFTDPAIDPLRPEAVMFEPQADGSLRAVGIEYVVLQEAWHAAGNEAPPSLMGHDFLPVTNFFDVPPFYALHVWLWKENPSGTFSPYNPTVSCPVEAGAGGAAPETMPTTGATADASWPPLLALSGGAGLLVLGWLLRPRRIQK